MTSALARRAGAWFESGADWRHGLRLAIAVVAAYTVSSALQLPESFWAVMSALIVARPTRGTTLGAGWDRVRGTTLGTLLGLAAVWFHLEWLGPSMWPPVLVALVATVAFTSALAPALRGAPISALIVLTAGGIAGHSALEVAELRSIEIGIGIACGVAVSLLLFATDARAAFDARCAKWLRTIAAATRDELTRDDVEPADDRERRVESTRDALRELAMLAVGADREHRLLDLFRPTRTQAPSLRKAQARLMTRIASDRTAFVRVIGNAARGGASPDRAEIAAIIGDALDSAADLVGRAGTLELRALRELASDRATRAGLAPSATLLLQDLVQLRRLVRPELELRMKEASA